MRSYALHRLALVVPTVFGLLVVIFVAVRMLPGDIADYLVAVSGRYTPEQMRAIRADFHLNKSIPEQFGYYLRDLAHGDLGHSYYSRASTMSVVGSRIGPTIELTVIATLLVVLVAGVLGTMGAAFYRTPGDLLSRILAVLCLSVPTFVWGIVILLLPALWFGWGPPLKFSPLTSNPVSNLEKIGPAAVALSLTAAGGTARLLRSSLLQVRREDFIRTAYAKGLAGRTVYLRHLLRPSLIPVLTVIGTFMGTILGGSVIAEAIFGIPGMGQSTLTSITRRDLPQIQTNVLVFGIGFILINLLVDLLYAVLDPRIEYQKQA